MHEAKGRTPIAPAYCSRISRSFLLVSLSSSASRLGEPVFMAALLPAVSAGVLG